MRTVVVPTLSQTARKDGASPRACSGAGDKGKRVGNAPLTQFWVVSSAAEVSTDAVSLVVVALSVDLGVLETDRDVPTF